METENEKQIRIMEEQIQKLKDHVECPRAMAPAGPDMIQGGGLESNTRGHRWGWLERSISP